MKYLIFLGLPLFALDQFTKWLVRQNIPYGAEIPIIPGFFSLVHASNTGAAFSMFTGNNFFFVGLAVAALAVIIFLLIRDSRAPQSGATAESPHKNIVRITRQRDPWKSDRSNFSRGGDRFSAFLRQRIFVAIIQRRRLLYLHRRRSADSRLFRKDAE